MAITKEEKKKKHTLPENLALEPTKQKEFANRVKRIREEYEGAIAPDRGVIYLGHIPHGFYESEMKSFFSQFGKVTRLRLSRSKKTGKSKGYAFIEFENSEVAEIAAETMNNYLMFERLLKCYILPSEKVHPNLFAGSSRAFSKPKSSSLSIIRHNSVKSEAKEKKLKSKTLLKQKKNLAKLAKLGVKLDLDSILSTSPKITKLESTTPKSKTEKKKAELSETAARKTFPEKINTPKGDVMVLMEDESETEISFKTPPHSIRSSKLTPAGKRKKSASDTPTSRKAGKEDITTKSGSSPKKIQEKSPGKSEIEETSNNECPPEMETPVTKESKKNTAKTVVNSAEKPIRMVTRSSTRKTTLAAQEKLKTLPSRARRQKSSKLTPPGKRKEPASDTPTSRKAGKEDITTKSGSSPKKIQKKSRGKSEIEETSNNERPAEMETQ